MYQSLLLLFLLKPFNRATINTYKSSKNITPHLDKASQFQASQEVVQGREHLAR